MQKELVCTLVFSFETNRQNHPCPRRPLQNSSITVSLYAVRCTTINCAQLQINVNIHLSVYAYRIYVYSEDYLSVLFLCALETFVESATVYKTRERINSHQTTKSNWTTTLDACIVQHSDNNFITPELHVIYINFATM